jgi:hypothetical protein
MATDTLYRSHNFAFFDAHHWEDWVELCCIASLDGEADVAGIAERLRQERDTRGKSEPPENDAPDGEETNGDELEVGESEGLLAQAAWATEPDKRTLQVKDWFLSLASRARLLGDNYPFVVSADNAKLNLRANSTDAHRLYIALLMMANLHYFQGMQADLTSSFESIGASVFSWLLPAHATVHRFGKGIGNTGRYQGHVWDKLKLLADDLSCGIKCRKDQYAANDTGDDGLDLVGWVPWQDSASGRLLLLGQCACTPNWVSKQHAVSVGTWNSKIEFVTNPLPVILIPYFLRTNSGGWHGATDFAGHLIVDRLRFLRILGANAANLMHLPAFGHVNTCLTTKEGAF